MYEVPVLPLVNTYLALVNRMRQPTVVVRGDVLSSWLTVSDYTKSRLAAELGVSRGRISQLLTSHEEPSAHLIAKLLLLTRLPFDRLFILTGTEVALNGLHPMDAHKRVRTNGKNHEEAAGVGHHAKNAPAVSG